MRAQARALPELFLQRLARIVPSSQFDAIANSFTQPKPTTFRLNPLKTSFESVWSQLTEHGFRLERVPWYREALILRQGSLRDLQETELYRTGAIYVQSLSSMLPPLVLEPQPGESVLDLCAAPGSKTTQMAALMRGAGKIVANDNNRVRFFKLRANITQQDARNVETTLAPGEAFGKRSPETFDRVLVDAQCSAEGRFLTTEPKSYHYWSLRKIKEMAHKQKRLLGAGIAALRPGGVLVYSTCTFAPEENEAVIQWALERFDKTIILEPCALARRNITAGLAGWQGQAFDPSLSQARRVLPTQEMEGFFLARLRKV